MYQTSHTTRTYANLDLKKNKKTKNKKTFHSAKEEKLATYEDITT